MDRTFGTFRRDFDPYKIPPDFEAAHKHALANRVTNHADRFDDDAIEHEDELCPCCNFPFKSEPFGLCQAGPTELGELG